MNDPDQTMVLPVRAGAEPPERLWAFDRFTDDEEPILDPEATFTSLAFIRAALKRSAWLLCALAMAGLLLGYGLYAKFPPAYQASTSVLVTDGPNVNPANPAVAIQTDIALAQSSTVARQVVHELGLASSASSFIATYTVTDATSPVLILRVSAPSQVLIITASAPSSSDAVSRAAALAMEFLRFRADLARTQQQQVAAELDQQVSQAQQHLNSISAQLTQVSAQPSSPTEQAKLNSLQTQRAHASTALAQLRYYATTYMATVRSNTSLIVNDSQVIDTAAPIPHSHLKTAARDALEGLVGGLALGMGIVVILALVSDRLRRRDEVAAAVGAPVRLSVGTLQVRRWLRPLPGRANVGNANMRRVVTHLRSVVPVGSRPAGLAVVAVDNAKVVARAVTSFALSYASQGRRVVVADLSEGAHAARLLGNRALESAR